MTSAPLPIPAVRLTVPGVPGWLWGWASNQDAPEPGECAMPVWTVGIAGEADETVEAGLLTTEGGALVALSPEGLVMRAWAPGRWDTVRCVAGLAEELEEDEPILFGVPGG